MRIVRETIQRTIIKVYDNEESMLNDVKSHSEGICTRYGYNIIPEGQRDVWGYVAKFIKIEEV